MGYYISVPGTSGKAEFLVKNHGARQVTVEEAAEIVKDAGRAIVCVVYNPGEFDAAGFVYNEREFIRFSDYPGDRRVRRWFEMDRKLVEQLTRFRPPLQEIE